jgi:hypothetical protein
MFIGWGIDLGQLAHPLTSLRQGSSSPMSYYLFYALPIASGPSISVTPLEARYP